MVNKSIKQTTITSNKTNNPNSKSKQYLQNVKVETSNKASHKQAIKVNQGKH